MSENYYKMACQKVVAMQVALKAGIKRNWNEKLKANCVDEVTEDPPSAPSLNMRHKVYYVRRAIHLIPKWPPFCYSFVYFIWNQPLHSKECFPLNEPIRANLQVNKVILKWQPFWNKVYTCCYRVVETLVEFCEKWKKDEETLALSAFVPKVFIVFRNALFFYLDRNTVDVWQNSWSLVLCQ